MVRIARLIGFGTGALIGATACAMTPPSATSIDCTLVGADKLPASAGPSDTLCNRIRSAIASSAPASGVSVTVQVHTSHFISAAATLADGRTLPEQKVATSDAELNERAVEMLANGLARQIREAVQK
jgi:hypothetical protein